MHLPVTHSARNIRSHSSNSNRPETFGELVLKKNKTETPITGQICGDQEPIYSQFT